MPLVIYALIRMGMNIEAIIWVDLRKRGNERRLILIIRNAYGLQDLF